jgi:hypothetical protein
MNDILSLIYVLFLLLSPIIILGSSFIIFKFVPFKKIRYIFYILYFVIFYCLNKAGISFKYGILDFVSFYILPIGICDITWNLILIKNKAIKITTIIIIALLFGLLALAWMIGGIAGFPDYITNKIIVKYEIDKNIYNIIEYDQSTALNHSKTFSLKKMYSKSLFEKKIDTWSTGESFRYKQDPRFSLGKENDTLGVFITYPDPLLKGSAYIDTLYHFKFIK